MRAMGRAAVAATTVGAVCALAACGPAPWLAETPTPSPSVTQSPTPTPTPEPVRNDLEEGTTSRDLTAGAVTASVTYWSDLSMDQWTAGAVKPVSLSMATTVSPDDGQKVYLQRASMIVVPASGSETFPALDEQADEATVAPGYLVLSPYSYSYTFSIGAVPDEATSVTVQLRYDFLVQTTPTSEEYAKQSTTDTLTVAIVAGD